MATITITVNAGAQTVTNTRTVTGPHLVRFIDAYRVLANMPEATDDEVLKQWGDDTFKRAQRLIRETEANAAAAAVTPIEFT